MSAMTDTELAAYLISRICHDFASPLTSVCNGAELLESDNAVLREQSGELVETGANALLAGLSFIRYAFGSVGLQSGKADIGEVRSVIDGYFSSDRLDVVWDGPEDVSFRRARLGLNLCLMASSCLPLGGRVHVQARTDVTATGYSDVIRIPDFVTSLVEGRPPEEGWSARTIHPFFAMRMCAEQGLSLAISHGADSLEVAARQSGK